MPKSPKNKVNPKLEALNATRAKEYTILLEDPLAFARMLAFTEVKQDINFSVNVTHGNQTLAVLKKEPFTKYDKDIMQSKESDFGSEAQFVWSYDSKATQYLSYRKFGEQLAKYDAETVKKIARLVLRYMRVATRQENTPQEQAKAQETLTLLNELVQIPKQPDALPPIEIFAQLLGSAACEVGRGQTAYVNLLATMNRIKHNEPDKLMRALINNIFANASTYDETKTDQFHATGFSGSQNIMRIESGLETDLTKFYQKGKGKIEDTIKTQQHKIWQQRYQKMLARDEKYMSQPKKQGDTADTRFEKKVIRHAKAAYQFASSAISSPQQTAATASVNASSSAPQPATANASISASSSAPTPSPNISDAMDVDTPHFSFSELQQQRKTKKLASINYGRTAQTTRSMPPETADYPLQKKRNHDAISPDDDSDDEISKKPTSSFAHGNKKPKHAEISDDQATSDQTLTGASTTKTLSLLGASSAPAPQTQINTDAELDKIRAEFNEALKMEKGKLNALNDLKQKVEKFLSNDEFKLAITALSKINKSIASALEQTQKEQSTSSSAPQTEPEDPDSQDNSNAPSLKLG